MDYLPLFLDVRGCTALIVGGGEVAARKVDWLQKAGARVRLVAPQLCAELAERAAVGAICHHPAPYDVSHLDSACLVIAATDDPAVNEAVARDAQANNVPVNVVDAPALSSFIVPAVVDRSPLVVAISSGGTAPVLARLLRARIEALLPTGYGHLAALARRWRPRVRHCLPDPTARRRFWERAFVGVLPALVCGGQEAAANRFLEDALARAHLPGIGRPPGMVHLVGAGPGDPDLLTLKAQRLLQDADMIVYDRLVAPAILDFARRDARRIFVGKSRAAHVMPQAEINRLLIRLAREGYRVVRLKGGDPFIFGRGGEELEALAQAGVAFEVVPGITAAIGCAAYAGIPLTHRDHAQACMFITGHTMDGQLDLNWPALARPRQTLVVYMGTKALPLLRRQLCAHGLDPSTPTAIVENGSMASQRVFVGTLDALADQAGSGALVCGPSIVIIGSVVGLGGRTAWFEGRPRAEPALPASSVSTAPCPPAAAEQAS